MNTNLSTSSNIVCECSHLTNFAVLLSFKPITNQVHNFALNFISYIGLGSSLLALLCTIVFLGSLRYLYRAYVEVMFIQTHTYITGLFGVCVPSFTLIFVSVSFWLI